MTAKQGVDHVLDMMTNLANNDPNLKIEFIDLFCEKGMENEINVNVNVKLFNYCLHH